MRGIANRLSTDMPFLATIESGLAIYSLHRLTQ